MDIDDYLEELDEQLKPLEDNENENEEEEEKNENLNEDEIDDEILKYDEPLRKSKIKRKQRVVTRPYLKGATEARRKKQLEEAVTSENIVSIIRSAVEKELTRQRVGKKEKEAILDDFTSPEVKRPEVKRPVAKRPVAEEYTVRDNSKPMMNWGDFLKN